MEEWSLINEINPHNFNSMCLDRLNLGNINLEHRVQSAKDISEKRLIIQADGYPMSGGEDDFNTTLQAVACADVINKKFNMRINKKEQTKTSGKASLKYKRFYRRMNHRIGIPILLSGGTNSLSRQLSEMAGVRCNGIAIGTYARDIIEDYVQHTNFYSDSNIIYNAYLEAKKLVESNKMKVQL